MKFIFGVILLFTVALAFEPSESKQLLTQFQVESIENFVQVYNPVLDFFNGFIEGLKNGFNRDVMFTKMCIACPMKLKEIWVDFYEFIKNNKWTWKELYDEVIDVLLDTLNNVAPCIIIGMSIKKFYDIITNPTIQNLQYIFLMSILGNIQDLMKLVPAILEDFFKGDYEGVGEDIGEILYLLAIH